MNQTLLYHDAVTCFEGRFTFTQQGVQTLIYNKNVVIWLLKIVIPGNTPEQPLHPMKAAARQAVNQRS